jgi:hypothetical protein
LTGLVKDYNTYKKTRNVTFVGVLTSPTATVKSLAHRVEEFKFKPFANMLDAGGATAAAYGVPRDEVLHLVVIDGGGKIVFNGSRGVFFVSATGKGKGSLVYPIQIDESLKKHPVGILGAAKPPTEMEMAAHYYDLQQFDLLEAELQKGEAKKSSPEAKEFAGLVRQKMADSRTRRKVQIENLSVADPVQAYRKAMEFVTAFPNDPERTALLGKGRELLKLPVVKKEMDAEAAYQRMVAPELKTTTLDHYTKVVQPLLDGYLKIYGETPYAALVKNACEAHRLALVRR